MQYDKFLIGLINTIILYYYPTFLLKHIKKSKRRARMRLKFKIMKMKIFENNIKKTQRTVTLRNKKGDLGKTKYFPAFTKEWKNTIYSFNQNIVKNIPVNNLNINKIIKSYFNLYFKDTKFINTEETKYINIKKRRNLLRRIFVSDAEIKYTNNKAVITLYVVNREKRILRDKFLMINNLISIKLLRRSYRLFRKNISIIYTTLSNYKNEYFFIKDIVRKNQFINYKLTYLNTFIKLKHLYFKKMWSIIINKYSWTYLSLVRKFYLVYSLNQYKFNKLILLPKLSTILTKIIGKKIEYNIINLKSIAYNADLFTNVLALKLKNLKNNYMKSIFSILNRAYLPVTNTITERASSKNDKFLSSKFKNLKLLSLLKKKNQNLDSILKKFDKTKHNTMKNQKPNTIHSLVYDSIGFKNMSGIRLEVKGRLTKRYRADRSIYFTKWKGGLKNIDSSFKRLSSVLFRGNTNSNVSYSLSTGKRRIGAFAVKGWIGGK